jgi:hypothetical protein
VTSHFKSNNQGALGIHPSPDRSPANQVSPVPLPTRHRWD